MFRAILLVTSLFIGSQSFCQEKVHLQVQDTGRDPLPSATVSTSEGLFIIASETGKISFSPTKFPVFLLTEHVGYRDQIDTLSSAGSYLVTLRAEASEMESVVINASSAAAQLAQASTDLSFRLESVKHLPYLLGERDPIKFIQTQAGVSTGTDGNNGYFVRGGGIDQNAIRLDHMEFYNASHLFGFFSMFNANAIERATFTKAGYPAHIGGRLSSRLDLQTSTPSYERVEGQVGVGLLSANVTLGVPLSEQSAFMVSARRSYLDLITQNAFKENSGVRRSTDYRFSDLILKYAQQIGEKHLLSITGFVGQDAYDYRSSRTFRNDMYWKTRSIGMVWKWLIHANQDLEFYANGGTFDQEFVAEIVSFELAMSSYIQNVRSGLLYHVDINNHSLTFGMESTYRGFRPSEVKVNTGKVAVDLEHSEMMHTAEWSVSVQDDLALDVQWRLGIGLRMSGFSQFGPFERVNAIEASDQVDTLRYRRGEVVQTYVGLEPRIRLSYLLDPRSSVKASFDRTFQYIHLSPLSSVSLPTDLWVPSTSRVKPQVAHQLSIAYHRVAVEWPVSWSIGAFGKQMSNQVEWRDGAIAGYSDSPNLDDDLIFGKGYSVGLEATIKKELGVVTGQLNYTLSRTRRQFDEINGGDFFPAKYDRTHDLNVVASWKKDQWTFGAMLKLASGTALTLPTAKYLIGERVISEYSSRNALRMPLYHRMDVSASLVPRRHPNATWVFSVYNLYNRRNPYFMYFDVQGSVENYSLDINLEEVSLFPIMPSVSYELEF
ncbi:TonB-dependent receptor plug domain-containing protein [Marinoscillum furvescens]|uniref:Outer membrane receptor protein involved in Fe transport n=1 Tax=Marinoscillum furvescens DSM 4134 TaxID=1122208 RepID=A0A3D9L082_MARFU|nr:TonB-dependent receptor [Marinoscillum furvescens]RED96586.1 outer membrane receptor protein involved in Fe transport [Marinoscillum furvescens DSM 4134]